MQNIRSLLFNFFLYFGIIFVFLIAIPALILPSKVTLIFGKILAYYIIFILRIFLGTKVIFNGLENLKKNKRFFLASAHQSIDRKSTRLNSSHSQQSRMPSSA